MLQKNLLKLGFSDKEVEVYLSIIELGKTTPAQIALKTRINRTTVYANVSSLLKKGVIAEDLGGKSLYLFALPVDSLNKFVSLEEERLKKKKGLIEETIKEIEDIPLNNKNYSVPKIRFIEEADVEGFLYRNLEKWHKNALNIDGICWGFQDHSFAEQYGKWIDWGVKTFPENKIKLLSNQSEIEKKLKKVAESRTIKFWKKNIDFTSSTWVMGDYLIMLVTRQRPYYIVEIHDEVMSHNMREVFRSLWMDLK